MKKLIIAVFVVVVVVVVGTVSANKNAVADVGGCYSAKPICIGTHPVCVCDRTMNCFWACQ